MADPEHIAPARKDEEVADEINRKAHRRLRARQNRQRGVWFGLGMFGLVGWSVAVPTIAGVALGVWLDSRLGDRVSWTLTLLIIGVGLGCLNAWHWIKREGRND